MDRRAILLMPVLIWGTLLLLGAASLGYALVPNLPFKAAFALSVAATQGLLILAIFMNVRRASALIRITLLAAIIWLGFLFLMSFADLWTR